ncbi:MAG: hypothetical protein AAF821_17225 [Cyanobacteria bacterium P01_D01_bin.156]
MIQSLLKPLIWFCVVLMVVVSLWFRPVEASPSLVDPRLNRLESQVRSLQSQVTRLQSQLSRTNNNRSAGNHIPPVPAEPSFDDQFDTLAILIIELQQRVSALEDKLETLTEIPG